jgi:hypothetical protein
MNEEEVRNSADISWIDVVEIDRGEERDVVALAKMLAMPEREMGAVICP